MIKAGKRFLLVMMVLCLVIAEPAELPFAGRCNRVEAASSIKLSKTTLTLKVKGTATLKVTGTTKTVKWSSSDKSIATVKNGKVTAKKAGKATITAKVGTEKLTCAVTVKENAGDGKASEETVVGTLANPRIVADASMESGQNVTWDCVWFGSYPQAEVVPSGKYTALDEFLLSDGDIIVSDSIYSALQNAIGWDSNNEIILDEKKYRRIRKEDASYTCDSSDYFHPYYKWVDDISYHYFMYEPIKWRVLCIDGIQALLLSDIALDAQCYNPVTGTEDIFWQTSTIRSWLNGYGLDFNQQAMDYSHNSFLMSAFTDLECEAIDEIEVENADNIIYGTDGGNNTRDRIYLFSESEVCSTHKAISYGFNALQTVGDEARRCKSSSYAKAMGNWGSFNKKYAGNCCWYLRTPGSDKLSVVHINAAGEVNYSGDFTFYGNTGIRPALTLNLSYTSAYSYAGTVCSSGAVSEVPQGTQKIAADGKILGSTGIKTTVPAKKTISKLNIIAKAGKKKITIKTAKGAKVKVTLNKKYIKKGKKLVKAKTISAKKNKTGKVVIKLGKKLTKNTKITVNITKAGYKAKKKTIKVS